MQNTEIDLKNLPSTPLYPLKNPILTPEQLEQKRKDLIVDLNQKSKELTGLGLLDKLGGFVGYQTDNAKEREKQLTDLKTQALNNQLEFKDLPSVLKDEYYNKAQTSILSPLKTKNEIAKEDYQKDLQRKAILNKPSKELTQSDKELISDGSGFLNNVFDFITDKSEVERLKEYKEKEKAKDITKEIQKAYSAFSNIDKNKDFFSLFTSPNKEAQEKAKQDFETIAKNLYHFDSVIYNEKNEPFVVKGDKVYKINDGFIDNFTQSLLNNKFSLAGSVAGGLTGAKYGKNAGALGLVGGAIAGAALGASAGAASDAVITNLALDRENKADEIIRHALSEGALSLAGDTLMLGAGKVVKPLAKAPLKLAEMSMPFQFTKNFFTGNAKRASEIIETTLSKEQQEALKEFSTQFGGETKISVNNANDFLRDKIKDEVFTTPKAKEYIDIASGFHKLFKNDAKIAESLKPATTKNLSQGLATTLSGALKYQWTKFTLGTLYRNAPDRILGIKLPKALNEATAGTALKYHIKKALERSHTISDFNKNLELSAKNSKFTNNTLKIIEELNNGIKQASEEIKEKATKYEKALQELQKIDESKLTKEQQQVLKVFEGELDQTVIKGIDLNDLYLLDQGSRNAGARKILRKHYGEENTGGLTNDELINMSEVIKNGSVLLESFERLKNGFRYAYEWENNGVKLRLVVDDLNNGNKIFDFYSDRNFTDFRGASLHSGNHPYEPNPTQKLLTDQEDLLKNTENLNETPQNATNLSPLEQANAEKLAKLESERLESEKEFLRLKEQEKERKAALKRKLEHERGNAGNIESATKIEVREDIPAQTQAQIPKSRVRLNEREIYNLDYAIVKAKDLKPSFTTGGTQKRTDMNEEQIKSISQNFDPKKIFGSGGFEDLPIILHDGQVIAGNHRIQDMLNFTPKSRYIYEKAIKEYYHIDLKPDELLVRLPSKRLNNTEINNLAASSNQGRFNSESDHAIAVLSHYEAKLKELEKQLNADSIYSVNYPTAKAIGLFLASSLHN
ncbi:hypothetical protein HpUBN11_10180 [Helicobacter pylori]